MHRDQANITRHDLDWDPQGKCNSGRQAMTWELTQQYTELSSRPPACHGERTLDTELKTTCMSWERTLDTEIKTIHMS